LQKSNGLADFQEGSVKTVEYERPELITLTPAISAIRCVTQKAWDSPVMEIALLNETFSAYEDWEY